METKFTPGPWRLTDITEVPDWPVYSLQRGNEGGFTIQGRAPARVHGDAHLIAAAPELYEALDELVEAIKFAGDVSDLWEQTQDARAALAKARGEAE